MKKLFIASNNRHKIEEFGQIFAGLPLEVTYPQQAGLELDPAETGQTFEENAVIKAKAFVAATGLLTLADDSGLEIDALHGEPGVYSARYGQTAKDDHVGRYQLVLQKLASLNLPASARTARFRCVIAVAAPDGRLELAEGTIEGLISHEPAGQYGFGYDPIFFIPEFNRTIAQLSPETKNEISHRGRAARAAIPLIKKLLNA